MSKNQGDVATTTRCLPLFRKSQHLVECHWWSPTSIFFDGMFVWKASERLVTQELYGVLDPQTRDWTDGSSAEQLETGGQIAVTAILWLKQCHEPPIFWWFQPFMVIWGMVYDCFNHIGAKSEAVVQDLQRDEPTTPSGQAMQAGSSLLVKLWRFRLLPYNPQYIG